MGGMLRAAVLALALLAFSAAAQVDRPNAVLLIAKPDLPDPRFARAVILVTQTPEAQTVGVVLNRPTQLGLQQLRPDAPRAYTDKVYFGGPVMEGILVALFKSPTPPVAASFQVLTGAYLSMHPAVIEPLLAKPDRSLRIFSGFSGWAPRQLQGELERDSWYVLPATEDIVFRKDTRGLWQELSERALRKKAALYFPS
jgi:putative transcriptional regulator